MKTIFNLEMLFLRFPQVSTNILKQLDNQSLARLKQSCKKLHKFIKNDKTIWDRKIRSQIKGKNKKYLFEWERVIQKAPMNIVRRLSRGLKKYGKKNILSPLHIATEMSNVQVFKHVFEKLANKNPYGCRRKKLQGEL